MIYICLIVYFIIWDIDLVDVEHQMMVRFVIPPDFIRSSQEQEAAFVF